MPFSKFTVYRFDFVFVDFLQMGRMRIETLEKMVSDAEAKLHPHHDACIALKSVVLRAYGYNPSTRGLARADNQTLKKKLG